MDKIAVYILAGGKSKRFESDKARALYQDKPLINHMAETVSPFAISVTVVADRADKYDDLGLATIADLLPDLGPIGGLYTALNHCPDNWLLLVSCDWLGIKGEWIKTLFGQRKCRAEAARPTAIAYRDTFWQPLLALYHKSSLAVVKVQIDANNLSLQHLLDKLDPVVLGLPRDWEEACQINTPEALDNYKNNF